MDKPTKEQQEEVWEWGGLTFLKDRRGTLIWYDSEGNFVDFGYPDLDLNNLFLYPVPKALKVIAGQGYCPPIMKLFQLWYDELVTQAGDSSNVEQAALALFWVLREVLNVKTIKS